MTEYVFPTLEANLQLQYSFKEFKEFCRKHELTELLGLRMDAINRVDSKMDLHWAFLWGEGLGPAIFKVDF